MLVLTNGTMLDGTGRVQTGNATVVINGNRIENAGSGIEYPEDAEVIDVRNFTIIPGLIDCHVHIGGFTVDKPGREIGKVALRDIVSFTWDYFRSYRHRRQLAIDNGVTTVRSAGDIYPGIVKLRDNIAGGKLTGPRIVTPGPTITAPGGHPSSTIYKNNRYIVENATRQIGTADSARMEVKKLAEGGVDWIKAIYSDINPMDSRHRVPRLSLDVLEALADEAHKHNLRLMVHTGSAEEVIDSVNAGADSIEHGILPGGDPVEFNDKLIESMLEAKVYFIPTLAIAWAYNTVYPDFFTHIKRIVKHLYDSGVKIAAGTDSGTPGVVIGRGLHKELELLVDAGLPPMDAIITATGNAAGAVGILAETGTIEKGKLADIIVIQGSPLESISNTRNIIMVIKDGVVLFKKTGRK